MRALSSAQVKGSWSAVSLGDVLIVGAVIGLVNVLLFGGFVATCVTVYNSCSELTGGMQLTLSELPTHHPR